MAATSPDEPERVTYASVPVAERATAGFVAVAIAAAGALVVPFGGRVLGENDAVFPALYAAALVAMLVSATISRNQFKATGLPTLAVLSNLFGISAVMLVAYAAVMPHVVNPTGFGLGDQSAAWLWVARHVAFAVLILAYAVAESYGSKRVLSGEASHDFGTRFAFASAFVASASIAALLVLRAKLPSLGDAGSFSPLFHRVVEPGLLGLDAVALVALVAVTRLRHTTSVWLAVVTLAIGVQTYVGSEGGRGQFTIGWYVLLAAGVVVQALYLLVQLRSASDQLVAFAADKKSLIEVTLRDPLTDLLNRRGFDERFDDILSESRLSGKAASIVLFDIDHFKAFNDSFGHPAGDDALKKIAEAVAIVANRPTDACCRVGGEEFAIVLGETDASGAMTVAERIRATVMRLRLPQDPAISKMLTVSVGTATAFPNVILTSADLYVRADKALYKAKRLGRNRIATHDVSRDGDLQTA